LIFVNPNCHRRRPNRPSLLIFPDLKSDRCGERELEKPPAERIFMFRLSLVLFAGLLLGGVASAQCQVTRPSSPRFVPPAGYAFKKPNSSSFPYGTDALWTYLLVDGKWHAYGKEGDGWVYSDKLTFWHRGFDWRKDEPNLTLTGKRLDGDAPPASFDHVNAVFLPSRDAAGMMTLVKVPTLGCWEITARYEGHELSYVVSVEPKPAPVTAEEMELYGNFLDSFLGTHGESKPTGLALNTVPLILHEGNKDDCSTEIGFRISEAANRGPRELAPSIIEGRAVYLVHPIGIGAKDWQAGVISLSEIGFDEDHSSAVFTFELVRTGAIGTFYREGAILVYRKTNGKWERSNPTCLNWMT
jgi:hypothetical protein